MKCKYLLMINIYIYCLSVKKYFTMKGKTVEVKRAVKGEQRGEGGRGGGRGGTRGGRGGGKIRRYLTDQLYKRNVAQCQHPV